MNQSQMKSWNEFYRDNGGTEQNANELYARFRAAGAAGDASVMSGCGNLPAVDAFIERCRNKFKKK